MLYSINSKIHTSSFEKPLYLKPWLDYNHSLTDKLHTLTGQVQLHVLSQGCTKSTWWDNFVLSIGEKSLFVREIIMKSHDISCWYARTIIPQTSYQRHALFFNRLKSESVKNLIFNNDSVHRVQLMVYPIDKQCIEWHWVSQYLPPQFNGQVWGRLAEFSILNENSFFLLEILLPQLERVNA